jgi:hypothetical protein
MNRSFVIQKLYDAQQAVRTHDIGMKMALVKGSQTNYAKHFLECEKAEAKAKALRQIVK